MSQFVNDVLAVLAFGALCGVYGFKLGARCRLRSQRFFGFGDGEKMTVHWHGIDLSTPSWHVADFGPLMRQGTPADAAPRPTIERFVLPDAWPEPSAFWLWDHDPVVERAVKWARDYTGDEWENVSTPDDLALNRVRIRAQRASELIENGG